MREKMRHVVTETLWTIDAEMQAKVRQNTTSGSLDWNVVPNMAIWRFDRHVRRNTKRSELRKPPRIVIT